MRALSSSPAGTDPCAGRRRGARRCPWRRWLPTALPGRAVLITFDDGYQDFADEAFPLLERHGFPATVFVVTDAAERTSRWDAAYGQAAPLMGWDEIRELSRRGVEFGSHTQTHPALC